MASPPSPLSREADPDLVVLDVMMPGMDGLGVLQNLQAAAGSQVPVIFLTARDTANDRIGGLRAGGRLRRQAVQRRGTACARARRVAHALRRTRPGRRPAVADLELDENSHEVTRAGQEIHLTATEFELLRYLMRNERMVLSKAQILDRVWKYDFQGQSNIVELYIGYLRKKVDAVDPKLIHTVRGAGYVIKRAPRLTTSSPGGRCIILRSFRTLEPR